MLSQKERNKKLYGFEFDKNDVQKVLNALDMICPGRFIKDIDESILDIEAQGLLDKTEAELEFYLNHGLFPIEEGPVRPILKKAAKLKREYLLNKKMKKLKEVMGT